MPRHSEATLAAIKQAVDIIALVSDYLPLHRSGSKFKALCPFHNDHNPSLELNPERQSFKCWSCGAGGDIFDFVQAYERVEFPEALRMLAERAGVALDDPVATSPLSGITKTELLAVNAWAERVFAAALAQAPEALAYVERRGLAPESVARFRLGFAPDVRDWLAGQGRREGFGTALLERAGLVARSPEAPRLTRDRFRGRLIFPIHDVRGRPIGFGGRILPEIEQKLAAAGRHIAKYLNTPETPLFQKRRTLYAADLARPEARSAGWVAVVEGYTDVIAAHQVGLTNVVGTLGTALGDDHVLALRRLADRVVLVFDGDEAGQKAADRALELFLGHEVDVRVLSLPAELDPCDFLLAEGADAFRALVGRGVDPLTFALDRAAARFDFDSIEGARQAAEWVLSILARVPRRDGIDFKLGMALNNLSERLHLPVESLRRRLADLGRPPRMASARVPAGRVPDPGPAEAIRVDQLDVLDRELVGLVLNEPSLAGALITRVAAASLRDAPLRAILQACFDLYSEGELAAFDRVARRLEDPAIRSLAAGLILPTYDPQPMPEYVRPAPSEVRLTGLLDRWAARDRQERLRDLKAALAEVDPITSPDDYRALHTEYFRLLNRLDTKAKTAS